METLPAERLAEVRARIAAAAERAGREPATVRLIGASKTVDAGRLAGVVEAGLLDLGENRVQEAETKRVQGVTWHLIGHLQSNKAKKAVAPFACIHSVDSVDLLQKLDAAAREQGASPDVLVQIDLAGEATKFGAGAGEARRILDAALEARAVRVAGLMLIPPWNEDQEQTRPWFVRLRELRDAWRGEGVRPDALRHLSMGMSHDFEAAIEEGATLVRVGTAIFGKRTRSEG